MEDYSKIQECSHAPGVQVQTIPEDAINEESDSEGKVDKDERLPQKDLDKRIVPENEFSDSEEEGEGRKRLRLDKGGKNKESGEDTIKEDVKLDKVLQIMKVKCFSERAFQQRNITMMLPYFLIFLRFLITISGLTAENFSEVSSTMSPIVPKRNMGNGNEKDCGNWDNDTLGVIRVDFNCSDISERSKCDKEMSDKELFRGISKLECVTERSVASGDVVPGKQQGCLDCYGGNTTSLSNSIPTGPPAPDELTRRTTTDQPVAHFTSIFSDIWTRSLTAIRTTEGTTEGPNFATDKSANGTRVLQSYPWPVKKEAVVEGDLIIGGLMMVHEREDTITCGPIMPQGGVQAVEAMLYTIDQINANNFFVLPNITLGAHVLDDCDKDTYGLEMAVDFIKGEFIAEKLTKNIPSSLNNSVISNNQFGFQ
ncbi:uncharacterized protein [Leptinotarsa decemlineata]|uniref:uncharacterized protein n=1 Tax=Leptinotarsa decemlineata TaxID=7539 RepID=UPI003D30C995